MQRKNYRREKQRVAEELTLALNDPSIIILSGALKVRGKLKGWTKLLAVLKPGLLFLYKGKVKVCCLSLIELTISVSTIINCGHF